MCLSVCVLGVGAGGGRGGDGIADKIQMLHFQ